MHQLVHDYIPLSTAVQSIFMEFEGIALTLVNKKKKEKLKICGARNGFSRESSQLSTRAFVTRPPTYHSFIIFGSLSSFLHVKNAQIIDDSIFLARNPPSVLLGGGPDDEVTWGNDILIMRGLEKHFRFFSGL